MGRVNRNASFCHGSVLFLVEGARRPTPTQVALLVIRRERAEYLAPPPQRHDLTGLGALRGVLHDSAVPAADSRAIGPAGVLAGWSSGRLEFWSAGVLVGWSSGRLEFWSAGTAPAVVDLRVAEMVA